MTKVKKRFGLSPALNKGLSETVQIAEYEGMFRSIRVPLNEIEPDPDNPRKLSITAADLSKGLSKEDPIYATKHTELEKLETLSATIKNDGLLNPIIIFKMGSKYRIVAGERRFLASLLAGHKEIDARVFEQKPSPLSLKIIQWVENTEREDLSLVDRIDNIKDIINAYIHEHDLQFNDCNRETLSKITGLAIRQSHNYLSILKSSDLVQAAIRAGDIKNVDKAALISAIPSENIQQLAIDTCKKGASITELRKIISMGTHDEKQSSIEKSRIGKKKNPPVDSKIKMGVVEDPYIVKEIIESVLKNPRYQIYAAIFSDVNWQDVTSVTKNFRKMLDVIKNAAVAEA